jgi:hypothetical protein
VTRPRRGTRSALLAAGLLLPGCNGQELTRRPDPPPDAATWVVVWVAIGLAGLVAGALVTWPALRERRGARFATGFLGAQAGLLAVLGAIGVGAVIRSEQLVRRPVEELPQVALLEISTIGDDTFSGVLLIGLAIFVAMPALLLGLAARLAASEGRLQRWTACGVLGLQLLGGVLLGSYLLTEDRVGTAAAAVAANLVLASVALASCWPRPAGRAS